MPFIVKSPLNDTSPPTTNLPLKETSLLTNNLLFKDTSPDVNNRAFNDKSTLLSKDEPEEPEDCAVKY